jgi:hypothetical protein
MNLESAPERQTFFLKQTLPNLDIIMQITIDNCLGRAMKRQRFVAAWVKDIVSPKHSRMSVAS